VILILVYFLNLILYNPTGTLDMANNLKFKIKKTAFLIIDLQNDFCQKNSNYCRLGYPVKQNCRIAQKIEKIIKKFQNKKILIFFVISNYNNYKIKGIKCGYCLKNTQGIKPYFGKAIAGKIILKKTHDGFYKTELDYYLKKNGIKNLIISGISTSVCVDTTARAAVCRGYNVVILKDAVVSRNQTLHRFALKNFSENFGYVMNSKDTINLIN